MINNIFTRLLKVLDVPHTEKYANELFRQQPYKNTMFGLKLLLDKYKITNDCVKFVDTSIIMDRISPMIVVLKGKFVIVKEITKTTVLLINISGSETELSRASFLSQWDGVALLVNPNLESSEPDIESHHTMKNKAIFKNGSILVSFLFIIFIGIELNPYNHDWFWYILLLLNALGIYVTGLLLQKQLNIHNRIADKMCSFIKESKCEDVTNSTGGSLLGLVKLSEVGFAFFFVNFLALLFLPNFLFFCALSSIIVLPFSFWSVWYQKYKAKSWCALCLLSLLIMWIQAFIYVLSDRLKFDWDWIAALTLCLLYIVSTLILNKLMSLFSIRQDASYWKQEFENLKVQDEVIQSFQQKMPCYDTSVLNCSCMVFGNPLAPRNITVFSNPYCNPFAKMHKRIKNLPDANVSITYVMTAFSEELTNINRLFIAAYLQLGAAATWNLMTEWYDTGRSQGVDFFKPYNLNINDLNVDIELSKQLNWRKDKPFHGTPTVLVNGKELNGPYEVEDYIYMPI